MEDTNLDPRKQPFLRPQNNPFSIFAAGDDSVPDIFAVGSGEVGEAESLLAKSSGKKKPSSKASVGVAVVPTIDTNFSLRPTSTPALPVVTTTTTTTSSSSSSVANGLNNNNNKVAAVAVAPPPPPLLPIAHDDDDSFEDDETAIAAVPDTRVAELELRIAQLNLEVVSLKEQVKKSSVVVEREAQMRKDAEDEVRVLQAKLTKQLKKEQEETKALESALGAIEAKLQAATARALAAETECVALRAKVSELSAGGANGEDGDVRQKLEQANKSLRRAGRLAANTSLELRDRAQKSAEELKSFVESAYKIAALLQNLEKVVPLDE